MDDASLSAASLEVGARAISFRRSSRVSTENSATFPHAKLHLHLQEKIMIAMSAKLLGEKDAFVSGERLLSTRLQMQMCFFAC